MPEVNIMMDFFNDKTLSAIIIIIIMACVLIGCTPKSLETQGPGQPTTLETVANSGSIASGLVCVFAPDVCVKRKELGETEDAK